MNVTISLILRLFFIFVLEVMNVVLLFGAAFFMKKKLLVSGSLFAACVFAFV